MPYESDKQRAWMHVNKPEIAARWDKEAKAKKPKVANPEYAEGMRQIRRSNAAGTHDNRPNRQRSRNDALRSAVKRSRDENED